MEKILVDTNEKFNTFYKNINKECFSFDTETTGLDLQKDTLVGISFADDRGSSYYLPLGHKHDKNLKLREVLQRLRELFFNAKLIVGHNLVFDMQVLKTIGIYPESVEWFDTLTAYHLLDENDNKGLKYLANKFLGYKMETFEEVSKGQTFADVRTEDGYSYACDDAVQTYKLYEMFRKGLEKTGLVQLFREINMPFLRCIIEMESNGILIDEDRIITLKTDLNNKIGVLLKEITQLIPPNFKAPNLLGGHNLIINLNSSQQLANLLHRELNIPIKEYTETGNPSMRTDALKKMKHPIAELLVKYKGYQKLLSGFVEAMPRHIKEDGKIHCRFNDAGTRTGRLSSSNPNLQQLPSSDEVKIRECFVSAPRRKFIVLDYSQEELRIAAHLSGDEDMIKAYLKGLDLHLLTANRVFNLGMTDEELKKPENKEKYYKERSNAKAIVFGILYGMSKYSLSGRLGITVDEAEKMIEQYFKAFPKVKKSIDKAHESVRTKGYVRNMYGRYRHFKKEAGQYPSSAYRQSYNFIIQGTCGDLLRVAMTNIYKYLIAMGGESKLIFTVHDEICIEVPELKVPFYMRNIKRIMEESLIINPPLIAEGNDGRNYYEAK